MYEQARPEVRGLLSQMEETINDQRFNNAMVPTQYAITLVNHGFAEHFGQIEEALRAINSRVYFMAVPNDYFGPQYKPMYPWKPEETPQHVLYVVMNGAAEAERFRQTEGIAVEQNLADLAFTGVVVIDPAAPENARFSAPLN